MTSSMTYIKYRSERAEGLYVAVFADRDGSPDPHARRLLEILVQHLMVQGIQLEAFTRDVLDDLTKSGIAAELDDQPNRKQVDFRYVIDFDFRSGANEVTMTIVETEDEETIFSGSLGKLKAWIVDEEQGAND